MMDEQKNDEPASFEMKLKEATKLKYVKLCRELYNRLCRKCQANIYMSVWLHLSNADMGKNRDSFIKSSDDLCDALKNLCPMCKRIYEKTLEENK